MKKKIFFSLMIVSALFITACGNTNNNAGKNEEGTKAVESQPIETKPSETQDSQPTNNNSGSITETEAKTIALEHAGAKEADTRRLTVKPDTENGIKVFEVEFYLGIREFEYYIDATTGEILEFSIHLDNFENLPPSTNEKFIGLDEAVNIALERAKVAKEDVRQISIDFDSFGKKAIYEFEFRANRDEFEVKIDAANGEIISFERD